MLTERDLAVLQLEKTWRAHTGLKETAIRQTLGITSSRYYQILNRIIHDRDALVAEPQLVNGLLDAKAARIVRKQARLLG